MSLLLAGGCGLATAPAPQSAPVPMPPPAVEASLFPGDAAVLSDEEINRILNYRYTPRAENRLGLINVGQEHWSAWSTEIAALTRENEQSLLTALRNSSAVKAASYLPSFLVPQKRTIPYLREAGARYQADLLLLYRTSCRTYERNRLIGSDASKAYCNVEAALVDVRTGIVPMTATASREYSAEKGPEDLNRADAVRKAELQATRDALAEIGRSVARFVSGGN